jgi:nitroreductase
MYFISVVLPFYFTFTLKLNLLLIMDYNDLLSLVRKNRSYRRFDESDKISEEMILRWIELARFSPSGRNMQPLKYVVSNTPEPNARIFENLAWAGYLRDWPGPAEGERPVSYVAVLKDKSLGENIYCDDGLAILGILLGASSDGYGGCIIGSFNKARITKLLNLPDHLEVLWIIALGKPVETVVLEELEGDDIRYWRDENQAHHVPKRKLEDLIFRIQPVNPS